MTTFAEGKARNLALGSGGTIASTLDGANPSIYGYRPEYIPINLGNSVSLGETVKLTVSFDLVMTVATANPTLQVYNSNNKGPMAFPGVNALAGEKHAAGETIEKRVAVTASWSPRSDANKPTNFLEFYSTYGTGNYFSISNLMVELGEVAHPWRPAPEDLSGVSDVVIATDTKTLAVTVDVQKVETFYYQTASTASAPAKPTTATPSGWQATEFAFDASKAVWTCQKTTLTDGTFYWGEVSKSSAYEGAVVSKNAADAAQTTANSANAREQRIYRSAASGTASMAATETWVTSAADAQGAWTTRRPTFSRDYPVLFTATQRQTVAQQAAGSTCTCTTPYVDESAAVAGNYITKVSTGGDAWVHSEGHGPDANGDATANTYGWRIGSVFELVRAGFSYIKMWVDTNLVPWLRIGREDSGHAVFSPSGMEVFDYDDTLSTPAAVSVAEFGKGGARIGKAFVNGASDNESHMELDFHSLKMIDKEGETYLHVSDLRDRDGFITDTFEGDGSATVFALSENTSNTNTMTVFVDDVAVTSGVTKSTSLISFTAAPSYGSVVKIKYEPQVIDVKAYTFGKRNASKTVGRYSVAEGYDTTASGQRSHAEGAYTTASSQGSHAEGYDTTASGQGSHAEGYYITASGDTSHAEGFSTTASGQGSHAEGYDTTASGYRSHAEGAYTTASGYRSHAQNVGTIAASDDQTALGKYNVSDANDTYAAIIGNGTADNARSNALAVTWDGDVELGSSGNRAIKAVGEVILNPIHGNATQYRMCFTGAGNIRLEKSTDSGATWATEGYFAKVESGMPASPSEWQTFQCASGAAAYDANSTPRYRKWGNVVNFKGAFKPTAEVAAGGSLTLGTLPTDYRPTGQKIDVLCQGSGSNV